MKKASEKYICFYWKNRFSNSDPAIGISKAFFPENEPSA
jgi:hypothetical protein